jgi:hypothetical protein
VHDFCSENAVICLYACLIKQVQRSSHMCRVWRYSSPAFFFFFFLSHLTVGLLLPPAGFTPMNEPRTFIAQEDGWTSVPVWTQGIEPLLSGRPTLSLVTTPTTPPCVQSKVTLPEFRSGYVAFCLYVVAVSSVVGRETGWNGKVGGFGTGTHEQIVLGRSDDGREWRIHGGEERNARDFSWRIREQANERN